MLKMFQCDLHITGRKSLNVSVSFNTNQLFGQESTLSSSNTCKFFDKSF